MTALAEQLRETTVGRVSRLYTLVMRELDKVNDNALAAQRRIADAVQNDPGLMRELCGDELRALIERKAYAYARQRVEDRRGDALTRESEAIGVVPEGARANLPPLPPSIQAEAARADAVRDREGMGLPCFANGPGASAHPPRETNDDEGGLGISATTASPPLPPSPSPEINGGGHANPASGHYRLAPSRDPHRPGHARLTMADNARIQPTMRKSLLSEYRLANGQLLRKMTFRDAFKIETAYRRDAELLKLIRQHAANIAPSSEIGDVITETVFANFLSKIEEMDHAA